MNLLIKNELYIKAINDLTKKRGLNIVDGSFHIKHLFEQEIKKSDFSIEDLLNTLKENYSILIEYINILSQMEDDNLNGEFAEGDEQNEDEEWEEECDNDVPKYFLISSLIELSYLKNNMTKELDAYFLKRGIPHRKEYIKELQKIYKKAVMSQSK